MDEQRQKDLLLRGLMLKREVMDPAKKAALDAIFAKLAQMPEFNSRSRPSK